MPTRHKDFLILAEAPILRQQGCRFCNLDKGLGPVRKENGYLTTQGDVLRKASYEPGRTLKPAYLIKAWRTQFLCRHMTSLLAFPLKING